MQTAQDTSRDTWRLNRPVSLAAAIAAAGVFAPFFTLRQHRLDAGQGYSIASGWPLLAVALVLLAILALACASNGTARLHRRYGCLVPGALLVILPWLIAGLEGSAILFEQNLDLGRIAPSTGFWLLSLAGVVIIGESFRDLSRWQRTTVTSGMVALLVILLQTGLLDDIAFVQEYLVRQDRFADEVFAHVRIAFMSVGMACVVGVPAGIVSYRHEGFRRPVFSVINGLQTIPSLALFGLMIAPLALLSQRFPVLRQLGIRGVGNTPAVIALFLYSLLPIVRNTYTSLSVMDRAVIDAGRGMGMTRGQLLRMVEVPISLPVILSGVRVASVQTIGNTTVAALIGAGGLGNFVFQGLGQAAPDLIVMGVIPIVVLAILVDRFFGLIITYIVPGNRT